MQSDSATHPPPALFLDRDGTVIREEHYLSDPDKVALIEGVGPALKRAQDAGFRLVLVTNQSGLARGKFTPSDFEAVQARLAALLAEHKVHFDQVLFCPHHPEHGGPCGCRKPASGLIEEALSIRPYDLSKSWVVGDKESDLGLGEGLGIASALVRTGYGKEAEANRVPGRIGACFDSLTDFLEALLRGDLVPRGVLPRPLFEATLRRLREEGRQVVFTNGCFDLLHVGHLRYLQAARKLGDFLAIGVNADASVTRLKGPTRPLTPEDERQEMLAGLGCVDFVTRFDEDTPFELIRASRPQFLVKGADWAGNVVGSDLVEADGGEVRLIRFVPGRSSTEIIRRSAQAAKKEGLLDGGL